ncbi:MAG: adenylate cyclase [Actinomycetota bacterium]
MNEIERAFVVDPRTDIEPYLARAVRCTALRQAYVAIDDPGGGHVEVRVRSTDDRQLLTVKGGVGLTRTEVELPIDAAQANALWPLAGDRVIEKLRYTVPLDTDTDTMEVELDVYAGRFAGLVMTELEFSDAATALAFEPPAWFGTEVTDDHRWGNANLARYGRPDGRNGGV